MVRPKPQFQAFWRDCLAHFKEARILLVSSSLAYTTILSIIPLLAVSFAIFQAFGGMENLYATIEPYILQNLAESSGQEAIKRLHEFISNTRAKTVGIGGLVGLIFTSISMLSSAENAFNAVWRVADSRPWLYRVAIYWFFITLGPLALAVAVGTVTSHKVDMHLLPAGTGGFLLMILIFIAVYKGVPNREVHWRPAVISAVFTALLLTVAKAGYGIYTRKVVSYNKIYGSLGAIPILLLWIYVVWVIILSGTVLGASLQKRLDART